jgi:hypothetical protein
MRDYASFRGNWPVVPDGFESLRSLQLRLALKKHADVAPIIALQRDKGLCLQRPESRWCCPLTFSGFFSERALKVR